ncbi:homer protein homolog 2-like [Artemia franciscana]|uniref:WH1 domain-containing protein n=1 Tax=Artemia franciscana TaxID=6661 RepID=A0AA88H4C5_ARTSF|nr:hypothetical protein QYM36_016850 [Artemia franciscana]
MGEQPIFSCKAHVFHIDPKTKKSWVPASTTAISVSFFFDSTRSLYRIISVEGAKAVINSTVTPSMTFTKTSQKFGQWSDVRANTVYGLGFPSEAELNKFIEKFHEVKEATKNIGAGNKNTSNGSTPSGQILQPTNITSANASPIQSRSMGTSPAPSNQEEEAHPPITESHLSEDVHCQQIKGQYGTHQRSQSLSGSYQSTLESPTKKNLEKNHIAAVTTNASPSQNLLGGIPAPSSGAVEAQLKYENERLKLALAQSSANAKKWEVELATLKSNNARLTAALQESTANVEEWKRQLQAFKEENVALKSKLLDTETNKGDDFNSGELKKEITTLRLKCDSLETELKTKDEKVRGLSTELKDSLSVMENFKSLYEESQKNEKTTRLVLSRIDTALNSSRSQSILIENLRVVFLEKIKEIEDANIDVRNILEG